MYRIHYINEEIEPKERKIYLEKNIRLRGQIELEEDLHKTLTLISSKWKMQNNRKDQQTGFIYRTQSLEECLRQIEKTGVDKNYALHRWYNFKTSVQCEYIFCEYGAIHETNVYNHDVDIYINHVPFDVKLTVYPAKLNSRPYDLSTREGKDAMIRWYYASQSQQSRKQLLNRLYVVCDGADGEEKLAMKSNFSLMREQISAFMEQVKEDGLHEITITDQGKTYRLKSDIIYLH